MDNKMIECKECGAMVKEHLYEECNNCSGHINEYGDRCCAGCYICDTCADGVENKYDLCETCACCFNCCECDSPEE